MTITAREMAESLGQHVALRVKDGDLRVTCKVLDAKVSYSTLRFLLSPISGSGEVWVNAESTTRVEG